ncbi:hypothetical protein [Paracoccus sp. (in: a-proteobacteria)]|uniref:hypothetical protein n=1 Tax=Paracoccus sp. TaxID=267 RepID=UPI0026E01592|nr:hypothetical protein [Paracoccus sp. (in: a-proteobacteria)]MDO5648715.1 hypothetical protein [Paracoccus sp. (in: a-proteobacteria)]
MSPRFDRPENPLAARVAMLENEVRRLQGCVQCAAPSDPRRRHEVTVLIADVLRHAARLPGAQGLNALGERYSDLKVKPAEMKAVLISVITDAFKDSDGFFDLLWMICSLNSPADFIELIETPE